jgi:hypothetical protein
MCLKENPKNCGNHKELGNHGKNSASIANFSLRAFRFQFYLFSSAGQGRAQSLWWDKLVGSRNPYFGDSFLVTVGRRLPRKDGRQPYDQAQRKFGPELMENYDIEPFPV